uniref:Dolichyl-diphosphooligosaccharide--protein glycosyltransferase subunit 1 n=1 Tax=Araucaria cunninghamii TaxID=56994 RepID=A0A0D6R1Y4_ARACU
MDLERLGTAGDGAIRSRRGREREQENGKYLIALVGMSVLLLSTYQTCVAAAADWRSELVILRVDRKIDLTSHIVRVVMSLKVENTGSTRASDVIVAFPPGQVDNLAYLRASAAEGRGKNKVTVPLTANPFQSEDVPSGAALFSIALLKPLNKGETVTIEVLSVFTHSLMPLPEEITQAQSQLVIYRDSAYVLSPYPVKLQSTTVKTPSPRIESYTKVDPTKVVDAEIKYGPYENLPAFSFSSFIVHFENNQPFAVVKELVREIEISHWGNVQITEHYHLVHGGARLKAGFSRIEYQARPNIRGASSFKSLVARLPPRAHSVYYRDEIGNISTSHLKSDTRKTELEIEPRYPMFGGWQATFTIGYGLPLQDFLFQAADGRRYLNLTFASPFNDVVIDKLIVKVALPEGSKDPHVSIPISSVDQQQETKYSYLDTVGRTVVVLSKKNVIPEHNVFFQVYYNFSTFSMLAEPLMLVTGFFFFFLACILYSHFDFSISKSSVSYLAKLQREEVQDAIQRLQSVMNLRLAVSEKLEASLRDLARTGDVQACKAARKAADATLKDTAKELKSIHEFLQSSTQASHILPKVEELIHKEKEKQEKLLLKHSIVVDSVDKKLPSKEIDSRIASHEQKLVLLKQEVDELLQAVDDI